MAGRISSLEIIAERAMVSIITMAAPAEKPPR